MKVDSFSRWYEYVCENKHEKQIVMHCKRCAVHDLVWNMGKNSWFINQGHNKGHTTMIAKKIVGISKMSFIINGFVNVNNLSFGKDVLTYNHVYKYFKVIRNIHLWLDLWLHLCNDFVKNMFNNKHTDTREKYIF